MVSQVVLYSGKGFLTHYSCLRYSKGFYYNYMWIFLRVFVYSGVGEEVRGGDSILPEVASPTEALRIAMATTEWVSQSNGPVAQAIKQPLLSLCSRYSLTHCVV